MSPSRRISRAARRMGSSRNWCEPASPARASVMYFIEWRGYGLLGLLPPVLGLIALGFLVDDHTFRGAALGAGVAIAATGAALAVGGWYLNRAGNHHSLYGLPLWAWGGVYALLGLGLTGWILVLVQASGWKD